MANKDDAPFKAGDIVNLKSHRDAKMTVEYIVGDNNLWEVHCMYWNGTGFVREVIKDSACLEPSCKNNQ